MNPADVCIPLKAARKKKLKANLKLERVIKGVAAQLNDNSSVIISAATKAIKNDIRKQGANFWIVQRDGTDRLATDVEATVEISQRLSDIVRKVQAKKERKGDQKSKSGKKSKLTDKVNVVGKAKTHLLTPTKQTKSDDSSSSAESPDHHPNHINMDTIANFDPSTRQRWRVHPVAENYATLVNTNMSPGSGPSNQSAHPTLTLGTSPLQPPAWMETWNAFEIATFEAAVCLYGKAFHHVQRVVRTKSTKDIVAFYYLWKKTSHFHMWKPKHVHDVDDDFDHADNDNTMDHDKVRTTTASLGTKSVPEKPSARKVLKPLKQT